MSRGACEDSREVGSRVVNPPRNVGEKRRSGMDGGLQRVETEEASYYYQFACLRSFGLPLSSFHLGDTGGLFPSIYFSTPIRDPQRSFLLPSSISPLRTLSRNFVPGREDFCFTFPYVDVNFNKINSRVNLICTHKI